MAERATLGFAGLLRQLRAEAELTQQELAKTAGVSPRAVSDLERGINRTARKDTAKQLAGALGLAEPVRSLFVAAALGRIQAAQVLAARRRQAQGGSLAPAGGMHGFVPTLTSFVGRAGSVSEVAALLDCNRLVTVTGPGGAGKTRLAGEVARQVAGRFADGVWLAELAPVHDPALVPAVVAAGLGVREQPGLSVAGALAQVLARRQLLLVLDNCEHVIGAAAGLCAGLLASCDDVRVLATSREPLRAAGEARYRLGPLALPDLDDLADVVRTEAVALFADRARRADTHFTVDEQTGPAVARLVRRLDGMPLAIELAAARMEALGVAQLLDRLDDRFGLLVTAGDRVAADRQQSLEATVRWSYRLLDERERRVFRAVSVFLGSFTLEAAEAVAGEGAGAAVLRLVDCSLLSPPQTGPDGRHRYVMLETLRAYGAELLVRAGEQGAAEAALAGYALEVALEAATGLQTGTEEAAAARWLDAEDATMRQVLAWAMAQDAAVALRLAVALGRWWRLRGRLAGQYSLLREAAGRTEPGSDAWCAAQYWLGRAAMISADPARALGHFTAACDTDGARGPSRGLADGLDGRSIALLTMGRSAEGADDSRRSLAMARELGYLAGQARALESLGIAALYNGDFDGAVQLARQAEQIMAGIPGSMSSRASAILTEVLIGAGDLTTAENACAAGLARSRDTGNAESLPYLLMTMAYLDVQAGRIRDAAAHLREGLQAAARTGDWADLLNGVWYCGFLCAATGRYAEAVTVWAADAAFSQERGLAAWTADARPEEQALRKARQALGPARTSAAEARGAAMSPATATEYALMLTSPDSPAAAQGPGKLSAREQELVTLVAQGRTNAQIAAQLYISVRTVSSHLDRIRDKTGCRRRADLTRLALNAGLV
jgi:predicted ATPase/DNA-binding CsgD family transcriptional regulator/transcriptional regulator with XRE-family HTH domain